MEGGSNIVLKVFLVVAHAVAICVGIWAARWTPAPLGEDAPVDVFSEGRALQHVRHLAETIGHRQVGSPGLTQAVAYLVDVLEGYKREGQKLHPELEIEVDVQYGTGWTTIFIFDHVMHNAYSDIPNVALRIAPRGSSASNHDASNTTSLRQGGGDGGSKNSQGGGVQVPGILVNSHFDSTLGTAGASDATSLIGIMLETARLMTCTRALTVAAPVVFLFNGAEETLLQGGHAWYSQHPWAADLRAVINLESTGPGGPDLLFQVKGEWAVDAYARAAKYPHGSVTAQDLFDSGIIKLDTDFRTFTSDSGDLDGVDIAYVLDGYYYHTSLDDLAHLWPGALQMLGENVVSLLPEFGRAMVREGNRLKHRGDAPSSNFPSSDPPSSTTSEPAHRHYNTVKHTMPDPATVAARKAAMPVYFDYLGAVMFKYSMTAARWLHTAPLALMLAMPLIARALLALLRRARPRHLAHRLGPAATDSSTGPSLEQAMIMPNDYSLWDAMADSIAPRRLASSLLSAVASLLLAAVAPALVALLRTLVFRQPMRWYPRPWLAWLVYGAGSLLGFTLERMLARPRARPPIHNSNKHKGHSSPSSSTAGGKGAADEAGGSPRGPSTPPTLAAATPISPSWSSSSSSLITETTARDRGEAPVRARPAATRAAAAAGTLNASGTPQGRDTHGAAASALSGPGRAADDGHEKRPHAGDGGNLGVAPGGSAGPARVTIWELELATAVWGRGLLHALLAAGMTLGGLKGPYFFVAWALAASVFAAMQWASLILPALWSPNAHWGGGNPNAGPGGRSFAGEGTRGGGGNDSSSGRGGDGGGGGAMGASPPTSCFISLNAALLGQGRAQLAARVLALAFVPVSMCSALCFVLVQFLIEKSAMLGVLGTVGPDVVVAVLIGAATWLSLGTLAIPAISCGGVSLTCIDATPAPHPSADKSHHPAAPRHCKHCEPARSRAPLVAAILLVLILVSSLVSGRLDTFVASHPKRVILQHTYVHGPKFDAARAARVRAESASLDGAGRGVAPMYEPHGPAMTGFWAVKSSDPGALPSGIDAALRGLNRPRPKHDYTDASTWVSDEPGEDTVMTCDRGDMFLGIYPAGLNMHEAVTLVLSSLGVSSDRYIPRVEVVREHVDGEVDADGGAVPAVRVTVTIDTLVPAWITANITGEGLLRWAPNGAEGLESPAPTGVELPRSPAGAPMYPVRHVSSKTRWSFSIVRRGELVEDASSQEDEARNTYRRWDVPGRAVPGTRKDIPGEEPGRHALPGERPSGLSGGQDVPRARSAGLFMTGPSADGLNGGHHDAKGGSSGPAVGQPGGPLLLKLAVLYPQPSVEIEAAKAQFPSWADVMAFTVYLSEWEL